MPTITFNQWGFGLDLRQGPSTSDANRLRVLKNAYVTGGKTIRKRPGCELVGTLPSQTVGLFAGRGVLNTFHTSASPVVVPSALFEAHRLNTPGSVDLVRVHQVEVFNGYLYLSNDWTGGTSSHHYLDGGPSTLIADVNCPNTPQIKKAAGKMWARGTNGETVPFSATNDPRDWTTPNDAGFLPVGLQQLGSDDVVGLGFYSGKLVVFFSDSAQIWAVDADPANHAFEQAVQVGLAASFSPINFAGDVFFLSPAGVRSITQQSSVAANLTDSDIGSPIDEPLMNGELIGITSPRGQFFSGLGQYWLYSQNRALVFTFSRTNKISAWSLYEFPFALGYITELNGSLYIRSGNNVYRMARGVWTDGGTVYPVEIETGFLDFKAPGVLKQIIAMDAVTTGTAAFSHRYDPRSPELEAGPPVTISGDTRPGNRRPVELMTTNLATVIRNNDDQAFELHAVSFEYENLGLM